MATITLTNPQTAAETTTVDARGYAEVTLHADGLAGAEEVPVNIGGGAAWAEIGTLTATEPAMTVPGGLYQLEKPVTAGACGVYATPIARS